MLINWSLWVKVCPLQICQSLFEFFNLGGQSAVLLLNPALLSKKLYNNYYL
jgi:hypothetical protein